MNDRQILSTRSLTKKLQLGLQPAPAWATILCFVLLSALCVFAGAGSILRLLFPVGAFAVGVFLYRRYPILYLGFTWWLWFLTPWVRRLIDYRSGWVEPSTVLLAPFLATLVTLATFLRYLPKANSVGGLPFVLSCTSVFYGCLIGLINSSPNAVLLATLNWITPILLSFHLFVNWQDYPKYSRNMQRTFCWGGLLMGAYGVVQYLVAPDWDRFWLRNVIEKGGVSFGLPEPLSIRVFSTMNSSGPFAIVMMAALLLLLTDRGSIQIFASGFGYLSLLLTLVRSAWLGWFLGITIFGTSLKPNLQMRLIITILIMGMLVFPLTTVEPFSHIINDRLQTLTNVQEDKSYQARSATYNSVLGIALSQGLGKGFGDPGYDSAILDIFLNLGWLGAIPYLGGILLLLFKLLHCAERRFDPFASAAFAISLSTFAQTVGGNVLLGVQGVIFWCFLGISLAAHKYYQHQYTAIKPD